MKRLLPPRHALYLLPALGLMGLMLLYRLVFVGLFGGTHAFRAEGMGSALLLGLRFDARMTALLALPALMLLRLGESRVEASRLRRRLAVASQALALLCFMGTLFFVTSDVKRAKPWAAAFLLSALADRLLFRRMGLRTLKPLRWMWGGYAALSLLALLLAFGADLATFAYVRTRLNGTLLEFLANPLLSARMVWESYPVLRGALAVGLLLAALAIALRRLGAWAFRAPAPDRPWNRAATGLYTCLILGALWGRPSGYPLRWGDAHSLGNSFHASVALNPLLFLLETKQAARHGPDLGKVRASRALLARYLGAPEGSDTSLRRSLEPHPQLPPGAQPNLVFLHLESLAAFKMGIYGNPLHPTPFLDRLLQDSLFFDHFYVPVENTSRSLFALFYGIADVTPGNTATRNPLMVDQETLLNGLKGYRRAYFLGGSGNWAQIRATLKNNIEGLETFEQESFSSPKVDVWGICDADLLRESHARLERMPQPFFALLQTAGNHPPFTIPGHLDTFRPLALDAQQLRQGQFADNAEYNSLRLLDHSVERYFALARRSPYFSNTLFVLYGDHGVARGATDPRFGDVSLAYHHVPFAIYAPGFFPKGRRISQVASELDVLPTLMSLLGRRCEYNGLGRDLFDPRHAEHGAAFTYANFQNTPVMGLIQDGYYLNLGPGPREGLFRLDDPQGRNLLPEQQARARDMAALCRAFHQWSLHLMTHNRPKR